MYILYAKGDVHMDGSVIFAVCNILFSTKEKAEKYIHTFAERIRTLHGQDITLDYTVLSTVFDSEMDL
jgi:hypothetical protein